MPSNTVPAKNDDVNSCRRYWIFIAAALSFASPASASTMYPAPVQEHFMECNPTSAACFAVLVMVPCMAAGVPGLLPLMVAVPYVFGQNGQPGPASVLVFSCIVAYTALDAANNLAAILGYRDLCFFAHSALSAADNVTGTIAGTGESLC